MEAPESGDDFVDECPEDEDEGGEERHRLSNRLVFRAIALSSFSLFSTYSLGNFNLLEGFLGVDEFIEI